jgi:hypothetical protein
MIRYSSRYLDDRAIQRRWTDPRLDTVRISDIQAYLLRRRWKPVPPDRPGVLVFQEPGSGEEEPLYQFVPDTEQRRDYLTRVYELLAALAEIEDRYAGDILSDILRQSSPESVPANGPAAPTQPEPSPW